MNKIKGLGLISLFIFGCSTGLTGAQSSETKTAQQEKNSVGYINGTIRDSKSGEPVESVNIRIDKQETKTDKTGYYAINDIPAGTKMIELSKDGYENKKNQVIIETDVQTFSTFLTKINDNNSLSTPASDTPLPKEIPVQKTILPPVKTPQPIIKKLSKFVLTTSVLNPNRTSVSDSEQSFICTMDEDGNNLTKISGNLPDVSSPVFSPDKQKIAYTIRRKDYFMKIYVMNKDNSDIKMLSDDNSLTSDYFPSWSPDGSKIAYESGLDDFTTTSHIFIMDADGSNKIELGNGYRPSWSPDGNKIVYKNFVNSNGQIFVMNKDGTGKKQLTFTTGFYDTEKIRKENPGQYIIDPASTIYFYNEFPSWSPDGAKIAFKSFRDYVSGIFLMNSDGSNVINLTKNFPDATYSSPIWSPDGAKIAFISHSILENRINIIDTTGKVFITISINDDYVFYKLSDWISSN
jgi:hypothetical protein